MAPVKVTDEEIARRIEDMRETHAQMVDIPGDHAAAKGDFVIIKYEATHDGKPVKGVASESYPLDLSSSNLMPEFESGVTGMKVGEEKEIEIKFAEDYPDKDIAGKKIIFKVAVKEIKEKRLPEMRRRFCQGRGVRGHGGPERAKSERARKRRRRHKRKSDHGQGREPSCSTKPIYLCLPGSFRSEWRRSLRTPRVG